MVKSVQALSAADKRELRELKKQFGDDPTPKTRCTPKMFGIFVKELIPMQPRAPAAAEYLRSRDSVLATGEAWDGANFPQMRLEDASPLYVDHTPTWDEVDDAREALDRETE